MIQSKKLIPEIYSQSYDLSIFTGLIDLIYTSRDVDLVRIKNAHTPHRVFKEDLIDVSSLLGLGETYDRDLLSMYRSMNQLKGVKEVLHAILCYIAGLTSQEGSSDIITEKVELSSAVGHRFILVTGYVDLDTMYTDLLSRLLDKLVPVNVFVTVRSRSEYSPLSYELSSDGTYYIVSGVGSSVITGKVTEIIIPNYYNGLPVTTIAGSAFAGNEAITSVRIAENIVSIGAKAFDSCTNLSSIIFEDEDDVWWLTSSISDNVVVTTSTVNQDSVGLINADALTNRLANESGIPLYYGSYSWTKDGYLYFTIYFDSAKGTGVPALTVLAGTYVAVTALPTPLLTGSTFVGWYLDADKTSLATGTIYMDRDRTLYAKYS